MSLLSVTEARELLKTGLNDAGLQRVIDREEAWIVRNFGAHYVDTNTTVVETLMLETAGESLFLRRVIASLSSIVEDGVTLAAADYRLWGGQGRVERLPAGTRWLPRVVITVTYVPFNDNELRKEAVIDLARLALERTTMQSESIADEYSYTVAEGGWDAQRAKVMRRLGFVGV